MAKKYVSEKELEHALEEEQLIKDDTRWGGYYDEDNIYYRDYLYEQKRKEREELYL